MGMKTPWQLLSAGVVLVLFTTSVQCCPSVCQCTTRNFQTSVDCSRKNLLTIPATIPYNTTELDLSHNYVQDLTYVFQNQNNNSEFLGLENLEILKLSNNSISSITESVFTKLSMLRELDLSDNNIEEMNDKTFKGLQNLTHLNLCGNKNLDLTNNTFHTLKSLVDLDLSNTDISTDNLWIPPTVKILHLTGNNWDRFNTSIIYNLQDIQFLDLSRNNLMDIELPPLPSLQILNISQNNIHNLSSNAFSALSSLHTLILDRNPFSQITVPVFQQLSQLQYLSVSHMDNLVYLNREAFRGLHSLTTLQMSDNHQLEYIHVTLFADLVNAKMINISYNNITALHPVTFSTMTNVTTDIQGNHLPCDCSITWIIEQDKPSPNVINSQDISCYENDQRVQLSKLNLEELQDHCGEITVLANETEYQSPIGASVILHCEWTGNPAPLISWVTPRGNMFIYYPSHSLVWESHPTIEDVKENGLFHMDHTWHNTNSYHSELVENADRILVLNNGDLFIDYMLRSDTGVYECIVENSRNKTSIGMNLLIDTSILTEIKIWSFLIGLACAASFFTLNLIYCIISAIVRRCINQRRRDAIVKLVENMDQYKSAQLARLKENYYSQLNRIRDGYHNQLERIRDNYTSQAVRFKEGASQRREWASNKLDTIRDNYNSQVTRLKDNSAQKLEHLRDTYNNQLFKIRDYGSSQMARVHKKYKIKQRHVLKLLETMNFDNCRMIIDSECVRTESMIFETNLIHPDLNLITPSDSDTEYQTASSTNDTPTNSQLDLRRTEYINFLDPSSETSQHVDIDLHQTKEDNSSQSRGDNLIQINEENSSQMKESDFDDNIIEEMYDSCNELDQMLEQIQLIDESEEESDNKSNSGNIETCV